MTDRSNQCDGADRAAHGSLQSVIGLHSLWPVGAESFSVMIAARPTRPPGSVCLRHLSGAIETVPLDADVVTTAHGPRAGAAIARQVVSRSVLIDAPTDAVWPWVSQMMRGAGIYGWSKLETPQCQSARMLLPGVPPPAIGDRVGDSLELIAVEPGRALVWRCTRPLGLGGIVVEDLDLAYRLDPAENGGCCLTAQTSLPGDQLTAPLRQHVLDLVDCLLPAHQLWQIKQAVEPGCGATPTGVTPLRYQAAPFHPFMPP